MQIYLDLNIQLTLVYNIFALSMIRFRTLLHRNGTRHLACLSDKRLGNQITSFSSIHCKF